jgi:hypothetical protein
MFGDTVNLSTSIRLKALMDKFTLLLLLPRKKPSLFKFASHLSLGMDAIEIAWQELNVPGNMMCGVEGETGDMFMSTAVLFSIGPSKLQTAARFITLTSTSSSAGDIPSVDETALGIFLYLFCRYFAKIYGPSKICKNIHMASWPTALGT